MSEGPLPDGQEAKSLTTGQFPEDPPLPAPPAPVLPPLATPPPAEPPEAEAPPDAVPPPDAVVPPEALAPPEAVAPPDAVAPPEPLVPPEFVVPPIPIVPPKPTVPPELEPVVPPDWVAPPDPVVPPELDAPPEPLVPPLPPLDPPPDEPHPASVRGAISTAMAVERRKLADLIRFSAGSRGSKKAGLTHVEERAPRVRFGRLGSLVRDGADHLEVVALGAGVRALQPDQRRVAAVPLGDDRPQVVRRRVLGDVRPGERRAVVAGGAAVDLVLAGLGLVVARVVDGRDVDGVRVVGIQRRQAGVILLVGVPLGAHLHQIRQVPLRAVEAGVDRALVGIGAGRRRAAVVGPALHQDGDAAVGIAGHVVVPRAAQLHAADYRPGLEDLRERGDVLGVGGGRAAVLERGDGLAGIVVDHPILDVAGPQVVVVVAWMGLGAVEIDAPGVVAPVLEVAGAIADLLARGELAVVAPALAVVARDEGGRIGGHRANHAGDVAAEVPGDRVGHHVRAGAGPGAAVRRPVDLLLRPPGGAVEDAEAGDAIDPVT